MKIIKLGFISFIVLFSIITVFSLFIPSQIRISRAINMRSQKDAVLSLIKDSMRWREWNPAFADSVKEQFNVQVKFMAITDSSLICEWKQDNKQAITNGWNIYSTPGADSLTVQWYMDFHLKWYPWKKFESLFFDKVYGSMMEQGLTNIKSKIQ